MPAPNDSGVTRRQCDGPGQSQLSRFTVLSLMPGIGMLDMGFEQAGYSVVRGPDLIFGGDIRCFHAECGLFAGVICGTPCQDFSKLRRHEPTGYGLEMIGEFQRVVLEGGPDWWLLENVPQVPDVRIDGYSWQRIDLRASEFGLKQSRLRHFQFGSRNGVNLIIPRAETVTATEPCCTATEGEKSERRTWSEFCELQGLPAIKLPSFKQSARYRAVGNGVPVPMAYAVAMAIKNPIQGVTPCACGCGRPVTGKKTRAKAACRKRIQRRRESAGVNEPGCVTVAKSQRDIVT